MPNDSTPSSAATATRVTHATKPAELAQAEKSFDRVWQAIVDGAPADRRLNELLRAACHDQQILGYARCKRVEGLPPHDACADVGSDLCSRTAELLKAAGHSLEVASGLDRIAGTGDLFTRVAGQLWHMAVRASNEVANLRQHAALIDEPGDGLTAVLLDSREAK